MSTYLDKKICDIVERETGERVSPDSRFEDLPIDSLEYIDLIQVIAGELNREISDELASKVTTIGDLATGLVVQ